MSYFEMKIIPDTVFIQTEEGWVKGNKISNDLWGYKDVEVHTSDLSGMLNISLQAGDTAVQRIVFKWKCDVRTGSRILCDHWERSYGDMEWRGIIPERIMPWYFLVYEDGLTYGYGVKTGSNSMCFWQLSKNEIRLCMDVRCGGRGVQLSGKRLQLADVVSRRGREGELPFAAARAFCTLLCENPLMPTEPVYGGNNWYYAYGKSSHEEIMDDAARISGWSSSNKNRPFMVIDDGWQEMHVPGVEYNGGPWKCGNNQFPDMGGLAVQMKEIGVRPGIWYRPMLTVESLPESWILPSNHFNCKSAGKFLDPSIPDVLNLIALDIRRFTEWGYELVKYDFSTFDILGRWGFDMKTNLTDDGWCFADPSKTTAEVIKGLYNAIYMAAGDALLIGCNTVGHLGAGLFHIQRTGDDTSGRDWERTRKMGINTLAFRAPQHGAFYAVDADCVGLTTKIPWKLNRQWLSLLSKSGTPLFISAAREAVGKEQELAIRQAFEIASQPIPLGEPLDWMDTTCPEQWILNNERAVFNWDDTENAPAFHLWET